MSKYLEAREELQCSFYEGIWGLGCVLRERLWDDEVSDVTLIDAYYELEAFAEKMREMLGLTYSDIMDCEPPVISPKAITRTQNRNMWIKTLRELKEKEDNGDED